MERKYNKKSQILGDKMLEKYYKEILACTGCAFCKKACQVYLHTRKESDSPKGRIMISYGLLKGEIDEDMSIVESLQKCALCRLCESVCPSMIKIGDIIMAARHDLKKMMPEHEIILHEMEEQDYEITGEKLLVMDGKDEANGIASKLGAIAYYMDCELPQRIGRENRILKKFVEEAKRRKVKIIYYNPNCKKYFEGMNAISIVDMIKSIEEKDEKYAIHIPYDYDKQFMDKVKKLFEGKDVIYIHECCGGRNEFRRTFPEEAKKMAEDVVKKSMGRKIITVSMACYSHLKKYGATDLLHISTFKNI